MSLTICEFVWLSPKNIKYSSLQIFIRIKCSSINVAVVLVVVVYCSRVIIVVGMDAVVSTLKINMGKYLKSR